ncbi:benzoate 4-monooxygenase cytochrome P450 [Penicillium waksmanii]|uniref:benzoate 4-monooxygenase cytochrome P450 n=1 Tax=Penicillium waksmanii TaxID=69791 RepID=UPI002547E1CA|nr:benzoate 4-monooxygenase cytochrome P450 [Penicillium waksmanii]KAJ5973770.1 benzoate 4-monooxygenase cytochrome P450 [Penicillium waksmanii]
MAFASSISTILAGVVAYFIARYTYRLFFHPLSKIPGPKLAAISYLPEFYHDVVRKGMYMWEIEKMHQKYGPIIRINPREVHIKDPAFYDEIYAGGMRIRQKDPAFTVALLTPGAMASTNDHERHRQRRGVLSNFFSKKSVTDLESVIQDKVDTLKERFNRAFHEETVLSLPSVFAALTADMITHYCHGESRGYLIAPDFKNNHMEALDSLFTLFHINRFIPPLAHLLSRLPLESMKKWGILSGTIGELVDTRLQTRQRAAEALDATEKKTTGPKTLFDALTADSVPEEERTVNRLEDEASVLFGAGTETTARALSIAAFYLAKNQTLLEKLRGELKLVMPSPGSKPTWGGVIQEALRLSYGLSGRLARIAPTEDLVYKNHLIPAGTPVSQAIYFVHHDPTIFPEPEKFDPERWTRASNDGINLKKYMVSFNKGSRQCLGMNLAYAEMYLTLAMFARNFNVDLVNTTEDNIRLGRDMALPYPYEGRFSVRARITGIISY